VNKNKSPKFNVRRELVKLECRDCGADLEITDDIYAKCKFCGQKYIVNELLEKIPEASATKKSQPVQQQTSKPLFDEQQKKKVIYVLMYSVIMCVVGVLMVAFAQMGRGDSTGDRNTLWDGDIIISTQDKDDFEEDSPETWEGFRSQTMQQAVYHMFGKPADEVTKKELKSIKYLKIESYWDNYVISYSMADYQDYEPDYREKLPDYNGHILFGYNQEFEDTIQEFTVPYYEESRTLIFGDIRNFKNLTALSMPGSAEMDFSGMNHLTMIGGSWKLSYLLETNIPLDQIEVLSLSRCSLEGLDRFTSLKKLYIEGIEEESMDYLVQCTNLDTLFCNFCFEEVSYAPLKALTGLKTLYIDGGYNAIKDLSVISNFTELENLSITCTDILNIGFVKDLENLKTLRLSENSKLNNLEGIGTLENLEFLELNINSLYGDDPEYQEIGNLKNLKSLALHTVYELDFLYELDQLEELEVRLTFYNNLLEPISHMKNLKELTLAQFHTWPTDGEVFTVLYDLPQLKKLTIDAEQFDEPVDQLFMVEGLEELYITSCYFETAPAKVAGGDNLKVLDLSGTGFGDNYNGTLEDDQEVLRLYCEAAPNLEKLGLNYYAVTDLSVLNGMKSLKDLKLYCCELTKIPESIFEGCEALETLNLSMNQFADLSFVKNLPNLKDLDIWEGYVTDLTPLQACLKLRYVDARKNPIAENPFTDVVVLTGE